MNHSTETSFFLNLKVKKSLQAITSEPLFPSKKIIKYSLSSDSFEVLKKTPAQKIFYTGSYMTSTYLSYKSPEDFPSQLSNHLLNSFYSTQNLYIFPQNLSEVKIQRVHLYNEEKNFELLVTGHKKTIFQAVRSLGYSIVEELNDFSFRISKRVETSQVAVSELISSFNEFVKNVENEDRFQLKCIEIELQRRRRPSFAVQDGKLTFLEINSQMSSFRRISVTISVISGVISLKYTLNHDDFLKNGYLPEPEVKTLKKYLIKINKTLNEGFFSFQSKIVFQFSHHSSSITKENMCTSLMIQRDLDTINLHIPQFKKILLQDFTEEVFESSRVLKVVPAFTFKYFKSSPSTFEVIKDLKRALDTKNDYFLSNRFNHRKIHIQDQVVTCTVPMNFLTFSEMVNENPALVVLSINELIEELASVNLIFNNSDFPLNLFLWNEEKPVFNYQVCLSQVLQIHSSNIFKAMSKTKHSFLKEIRNFHFKTLKNSFQFFSIKEVKLLFENSEI